ncbi:insulinase family protein [Sporosarcina aquimarina]|uniref:EF-P 5-aminopentanol modification-associated protein YfmF n=1 Tax=Sporosarcina aquimarina TaxID=114975 RepID=UPI00203CD73F|nr:pitrilysin family protein [Sporosarcina aquimarina]MCM3757180.1 insulinase family protein [Sporosarcina aquimarina]
MSIPKDAIKSNLHVHVLESKNFKTITVELKFQTLLDRATITERTLLPGVLRAGSKLYPTAGAMQNELDDLYGASFQLYQSVTGNSHILTVQMEFANERFIDNENNLAENVFRFINEFLFNPKTSQSGFDKTTVGQEKEKLRKNLEASKDDKTSYADERLMDEMALGERYAVHPNGYLEDIDAITEQRLLSSYKALLETARIDVFVAGDVKPERTKELIEKVLTGVPSGSDLRLEEGAALPKEVKSVESSKIIREIDDIQQAKLHIGYRTQTIFTDDDFEALMVGSMLLGGHAGSLLFTTVREQHSLAYYVGADLDLFSDKLIIFCGIAPKDYEKTVEIIDEQIKILQTGTFSQDVLEDTKAMMVGSYQQALDGIGGMITTEYQKVLTGTQKTPQEMIEKFKSITREDIIRATSKLERDTTFILTSEEGQ